MALFRFQARRAIARTVVGLVVVAESKTVNGLRVHAMSQETCDRGRGAGFVNGDLQLLIEAFDVLQITLGADIIQREEVAALSHRSIRVGTISGAASSTGRGRR